MFYFNLICLGYHTFVIYVNDFPELHRNYCKISVYFIFASFKPKVVVIFLIQM